MVGEEQIRSIELYFSRMLKLLRDKITLRARFDNCYRFGEIGNEVGLGFVVSRIDCEVVGHLSCLFHMGLIISFLFAQVGWD